MPQNRTYDRRCYHKGRDFDVEVHSNLDFSGVDKIRENAGLPPMSKHYMVVRLRGTQFYSNTPLENLEDIPDAEKKAMDILLETEANPDEEIRFMKQIGFEVRN